MPLETVLVLVSAVYEQPGSLTEPLGEGSPGCLVETSLKKALETLGSAAAMAAEMVAAMAAAMAAATGTAADEGLEHWTSPALVCLSAATDRFADSEWACHAVACWPKVALQKRWAPELIAGLHQVDRAPFVRAPAH